jgi:SNF2 family DNA or RNA helicase
VTQHTDADDTCLEDTFVARLTEKKEKKAAESSARGNRNRSVAPVPGRQLGEDENGNRPSLLSIRKKTCKKKRTGTQASKKPSSKKQGNAKGKQNQNVTKMASDKPPSTSVQEGRFARENTAKFLEACASHPWGPIPHSTKTKAVMDRIMEAISNGEDRCVVFVQWISTLTILGAMLTGYGVKFLSLYGELPKHKRTESIEDFTAEQDIKVLLVTTGAGGQSLNLTAANYALIVDPWWNICRDDQAVGRIHRIGQEKETFPVKFAIKDSIDEKVLELQARKMEDIKRVNGRRQNTTHISIKEVAAEMHMNLSDDNDFIDDSGDIFEDVYESDDEMGQNEDSEDSYDSDEEDDGSKEDGDNDEDADWTP